MLSTVLVALMIALSAPDTTFDLYPAHRSLYERPYLAVRNAPACTLPPGALGPGDSGSRGVRVKIDDFAVYETGGPVLGGSMVRTRVAYADPDDLVVSLPSDSATKREATASVECRTESGEWSEVGRIRYATITADQSNPNGNSVRWFDPVLDSTITFPCGPNACLPKQWRVELDGRQLNDLSAAQPESPPVFDVATGTAPGLHLLTLSDTGWQHVVPVIVGFAAAPPSHAPPSTALATSQPAVSTHSAPVPWWLIAVLGAAFLALLLVTVGVWRSGTTRGRRMSLAIGAVALCFLAVAAFTILWPEQSSQDSRTPGTSLKPGPAILTGLEGLSAPAGTCGAPAPVALDGDSTTTFEVHGQPVRLDVNPKVARGDLDGDGADEVAVGITCTPVDGKVLIEQAFLVYTGKTGLPVFISAVNARYQAQTDYPRVGIVERVEIGLSTITSIEFVFRSEDAECCPSGRAVSTWTYADGVLSLMNTRECINGLCS